MEWLTKQAVWNFFLWNATGNLPQVEYSQWFWSYLVRHSVVVGWGQWAPLWLHNTISDYIHALQTLFGKSSHLRSDCMWWCFLQSNINILLCGIHVCTDCMWAQQIVISMLQASFTSILRMSRQSPWDAIEMWGMWHCVLGKQKCVVQTTNVSSK